jgi:putative transposase
MTFRFIEDHRQHWPVRLLCETLEVSTAGYYAWRQRTTSSQEQRRTALVVEIRAIHAETKARYGSPRVPAELAARGQDCCVNIVAKLMHDYQLPRQEHVVLSPVLCPQESLRLSTSERAAPMGL